jgi:hypothetical protein
VSDITERQWFSPSTLVSSTSKTGCVYINWNIKCSYRIVILIHYIIESFEEVVWSIVWRFPANWWQKEVLWRVWLYSYFILNILWNLLL